MSEFKNFSNAVRVQFEEMKAHTIYEVAMDRDELWAVYMGAFPEGTDPIFRERTEHDCSCCKHFIRNAASMVTINADLTVNTIWDGAAEYPYDIVTLAMADHVRSKVVENLFLHPERAIGTAYNNEMMESHIHRWNHFSIALPNAAYSKEGPTRKSQHASLVGVFKRGLSEISVSAIDTVLDLIVSDSLYRGNEAQARVEAFRVHKRAFNKINDAQSREAYVWLNYNDPSAGLRNTAIGELLLNLSGSMPLEDAVRKYEAIVAPENYRRSKALITPKMVEEAVKSIRTLGLEYAIQRRHARIGDLSVNDVLFVDNTVEGHMKDGLTNLLMTGVKPTPINMSSRPVTHISVDAFVTDVLPRAKNIDVVVRSQNKRNFVTLTAPEKTDVGTLFRWDNDFAWAYDGDVADSLKEKVKAAGGDVDAAFRVSLGWYCDDDLDLHCTTPTDHIYYGHKGGILDVDMNAGGRMNATDPVENMRWKRVPRDGVYHFEVNNFSRRSGGNGFELELEFDNEVFHYTYANTCGNHMECLTVHIVDGKLKKVEAAATLTGGTSSARTDEKWGVLTNTPVPVDSVMFSPNYWGENEEGQRHLMFMLRGCKNPEPVRGLFSEYLRPELHKHRKVFEVLGAKTKVDPADEQMSGVGFTVGRNDTATVVINGGETFEIQF